MSPFLTLLGGFAPVPPPTIGKEEKRPLDEIATVSLPLKSVIQRKAEDSDVPVSRNEGKNEGKKLQLRQQAIIDLIKSNPTISMIEMSSALNLSISTIEREIPKMHNLIKHISPKKGGLWEIINNS